MDLKVRVLAMAQSTEETWLDLSRASFSISQPNREAGKPSVASTAQSHPHPGVRLGIQAPPPHQVLVSTSSLREESLLPVAGR